MTTSSLQQQLPAWRNAERNLASRQYNIATSAPSLISRGGRQVAWSTQQAERHCKEIRCVHPTVPSTLDAKNTALAAATTSDGDSSTRLATRSCPADAKEVLESNAVASPLPIRPLRQQERMSTASLLAPVEDDLRSLDENLRKVLSAQNPLLMAAAEQIFGANGKRIRPALVFLVSRATAELTGLGNLTPQHRRLAEIVEMIHTASLMHDDVVDESNVRRGKDTIHQLFGTRVAVLAGDFIFAQTSWLVANLENIEVIKLISQVIKDFASGEIQQTTKLYNCEMSLQDYLRKSYCKTASLIAASTRSAAIFSGASFDIREKMFDYGKNLGLAFQIVDDILDFTETTEQLGKPAGSDLRKGDLTAPVLYALQQESGLQELIQSEFVDEGALEAAINLVHRSSGIDKARSLAREKGKTALSCLKCLPKGSMRSSLEGMVEYVLDRAH